MNTSGILSEEKRKRRAVELMESGMPVAEVARELDANPLSVYEWRRQAGITPETQKQRVPIWILVFLVVVVFLFAVAPILFGLLLPLLLTEVDQSLK